MAERQHLGDFAGSAREVEPPDGRVVDRALLERGTVGVGEIRRGGPRTCDKFRVQVMSASCLVAVDTFVYYS